MELQCGYKTLDTEQNIFSIVLKRVFYLNESRTKMLVIGLHAREGFKPYVNLLPNTGRGIRMNLEDWTNFSRELGLLSTYVFDCVDDVNLIPEKEFGQFIIFTQKQSKTSLK